ncbi:hypothetical protein, conserved [Trypanosoma brucei gambiense DAL972]|uniref:60Kd inner membrane protein n=1 Tax=Trypanosoma brucei gambiense (strain MHOM/CI/86/DAL972) TaxID=679716 RepID=D0A7C4_TRYB9|nr:hypothetical protein, conserved [Trypanosoma brucei gambiense DAL972]CBH17575.1 hypothetical protein, conserved [Trypanosoma brucei gambiense DAL972]|eukprot:XP_011779839.1 hypothetical protein, conserved [Trypanosoma brucei gambiense DAL972]
MSAHRFVSRGVLTRRLVSGCRLGPGAVAAPRATGLASPMTGAIRCFSWNPASWMNTDTIGRKSHQEIEEELPEVFAQQPMEVDDFIRPEKSVFERLEDFWDWIVGFLQPVEKQVEIMRHLRNEGVFGFDFGGWGNVFFFYGIFMRLCTLVPSLLSHRNALRLSHINPQLSEIATCQNRAKSDRSLSTAEKRVIKEGYNRMKYALMKKHHCAQWKNFLSMITAPVTLSAFISVRRLAVYETDLERAPFLWIVDLTMPDPTYGLPMICAGMFLMNFELNQMMQRGGRSSTGLYVRWGMRVGSVIGVYFFSSQPAAMFAYWIGLSTAGLLQPLLLRWQPFRDFFKLPDPPAVARAHIIVDVPGASLMERLFASKEERKRREAKRQALREERQKRKFDKIENYDDVVFEEETNHPRGKKVKD